MAQEEKNLIISQDVAQAILNYLVSKPFAEVHQLVGAMQQLQPATLPKLIEDEQEKAPGVEGPKPKPGGRKRTAK